MRPTRRYLAPMFLFLLSAAMALPTTGCQQLHSAMPVIDTVLVAIQDGAAVLNFIDSVAKIFFLAHPDAALQQKYDQAMGRCHLGLDTCVRSLQGVKELDSDQADAAFADFRAAYTDLTALLTDAGIMSAECGLRVSPGAPEQAVPRPLAFSIKGNH